MHPLFSVPGGINESNSYLLNNGLQEWLPDVAIGHPFFAAVECDRAVAVCARLSSHLKMLRKRTLKPLPHIHDLGSVASRDLLLLPRIKLSEPNPRCLPSILEYS